MRRLPASLFRLLQAQLLGLKFSGLGLRWPTTFSMSPKVVQRKGFDDSEPGKEIFPSTEIYNSLARSGSLHEEHYHESSL